MVLQLIAFILTALPQTQTIFQQVLSLAGSGQSSLEYVVYKAALHFFDKQRTSADLKN